MTEIRQQLFPIFLTLSLCIEVNVGETETHTTQLKFFSLMFFCKESENIF